MLTIPKNWSVITLSAEAFAFAEIAFAVSKVGVLKGNILHTVPATESISLVACCPVNAGDIVNRVTADANSCLTMVNTLLSFPAKAVGRPEKTN